MSQLDYARVALGLLFGGSVVFAAEPAWAHVDLFSPPARYPTNLQKDAPCGHPDNPPGDGEPAVFEAGQTITLRFEEFVDHTGHFRVALDPTGNDAFTSPANFDDFYNSPEVLLDDIPDAQEGGLHEVEVTLPDVTCDPCSLQLIQVMTDDGAFGPGTSDLYFQCADIVMVPAGSLGSSGGEMTAGSATNSSAGGTGPGGFTTAMGTGSEGSDTADSDDDAAGCSCTASAGGGAWWWLLLAPAARRRRRGGLPRRLE